MTAGSCSVAISRSRPPQCGHASTSIAKARCMRAAQLQAREPLFASTLSAPAASGAKAVGSHATRDHALAPAGARGQQTMANQQVRCRPRCHRRQTLQQLQRLEHQLARAGVPRRLQPQRDAPVAPPPQTPLRKGRTQNIAAQPLKPRPIVC